MGTTFQITYDGAPSDSLAAGVEAVLAQVDRSLSVYNAQSVISRVNRNETERVDSLLGALFVRSREIYEATDGAFDIASAPLFDAWGFGITRREPPTPEQIDSLQRFCGMHRIRLDGDRLVKDDPRVTLNANAIAKGFGVDAVARFLEREGIRNYIVEIGGEVRCRGRNSKGGLWRIGIDRPVDGNLLAGDDLQTVVLLSDRSLATSGNYRQYYEENGKRYGHTIHPATGYSASNQLLSATVVAADCTTADAYATVLMVMGLDSARQFLAAHPELDALLIYDDRGAFRTFRTAHIREEALCKGVN
jgi:thiamine biosynthesis lipoprotein